MDYSIMASTLGDSLFHEITIMQGRSKLAGWKVDQLNAINLNIYYLK